VNHDMAVKGVLSSEAFAAGSALIWLLHRVSADGPLILFFRCSVFTNATGEIACLCMRDEVRLKIATGFKCFMACRTLVESYTGVTSQMDC